MNFDEYQTQAAHTRVHDLTPEEARLVCGLGLVGEAGEIADLLKKHIGHRHPLDLDKLAKEIGDCAWYGAEAASLMGLSLSTALEHVYIENYQLDQRSRRHYSVGLCSLTEQSLDLATTALGLARMLNQPRVLQKQNGGHVLKAYWGNLERITPHLGFYSLAEILTANIAKLAARYPNGFTTEASLNRAGNV